MISAPEQQHLDRVWAELEQLAGTSSRPHAPTVQPEPRRWYIPAGDVPARAPLAVYRGPARGSARFHPASANRKLGPVDLVQYPDQPRPRPTPRAPFVSSTYSSIAATCPDSCAFKSSGCFASEGFTKIAGQKMDAAASGRSSLEVIREEARLIGKAFRGRGIPQDGARGGRDLRLHVGGDVGDARGAEVLGRAAAAWRARGGGSVWTYTHHWRAIPRAAWGKRLQVFASIERVEEIEQAAELGYPAALVVEAFASKRAHTVGDRWRIIPCPAETGGATCASCRLCLDRDILGMRAVIGFAVHGTGSVAAREALVQIRRRP